MGGEADPVKALQLLPGVSGGQEGAAGLFVRGGSPDQTLVLLDGAPVYNASHLLGFLSTFHPDALRSATLTKGAGSARYGGRLSSVLDVSMKEGDRHQRQTRGAVGLVSARVVTEGPIRPGRSSYLLALRRTYADALWRFFQTPDERAGYYFYDAVAKASAVGPKHGVYVSLYGGRDRFWTTYEEESDSYSEEYDGGLGWGNLTGTARWQAQLSPALLASATMGFTDYRLTFDEESDRAPAGRAHRHPHPLRQRRHRPLPPRRRRLPRRAGPPRARRARRHAARLSPVRLLRHGRRRGRGAEPACQPHPRAVRRALRRGCVRGRARVGRNGGAARRRALQPTGRRTARWSPGSRCASASGRRRPRSRLPRPASTSTSSRGAASACRSICGCPRRAGWGRSARGRRRPDVTREGPGGTTLSAEVFWKQMRGVLAPAEGAALLGPDAAGWEDRVEVGDGLARGAELLVRKREGRFTGWAAYTLAFSTRTFPGIDDGRSFPHRYDRRHDVALTAAYRLTARWTLSSTWVYATGHALWLPVGRVPDVQDGRGFGDGPSDPDGGAFLYGPRNGSRAPAYHRMDVAARHERPIPGGWRAWTLGVYNAYARRNPFFLYPRTARDGSLEYRQISPFVLIPALTYERSF